MTRSFGFVVVSLVASLTAGCDVRPAIPVARAAATDSTARGDVALTPHDSVLRAHPGYVIDSILPVDEEIRRFQSTLGPAPSGFVNGAESREALVRAFSLAIERHDTAALAKLVVDRAEFGYLVFPSSPNARPPYRQPPGVVWLTRSAASEKGAARLLERFGGRSLRISGVTCAAQPQRQGQNTVWTDCVATRTTPEGESHLRMFGPIIARNRQFKFLSLANGL